MNDLLAVIIRDGNKGIPFSFSTPRILKRKLIKQIL